MFHRACRGVFDPYKPKIKINMKSIIAINTENAKKYTLYGAILYEFFQDWHNALVESKQEPRMPISMHRLLTIFPYISINDMREGLKALLQAGILTKKRKRRNNFFFHSL